MKRPIHITAGVATTLIALSLFFWFKWPAIDSWCTGVHQRGVIKSLRAWGIEYSRVTDDSSAVHAAEMIAYIEWYYPPGPGYHGPPKVEAALQSQRKETIRQIIDGLQRYTGLNFGTNEQQWADWAKAHESRP